MYQIGGIDASVVEYIIVQTQKNYGQAQVSAIVLILIQYFAFAHSCMATQGGLTDFVSAIMGSCAIMMDGNGSDIYISFSSRCRYFHSACQPWTCELCL